VLFEAYLLSAGIEPLEALPVDGLSGGPAYNSQIWLRRLRIKARRIAEGKSGGSMHVGDSRWFDFGHRPSLRAAANRISQRM
jgi:hypothetical protein